MVRAMGFEYGLASQYPSGYTHQYHGRAGTTCATACGIGDGYTL